MIVVILSSYTCSKNLISYRYFIELPFTAIIAASLYISEFSPLVFTKQVMPQILMSSDFDEIILINILHKNNFIVGLAVCFILFSCYKVKRVFCDQFRNCVVWVMCRDCFSHLQWFWCIPNSSFFVSSNLWSVIHNCCVPFIVYGKLQRGLLMTSSGHSSVKLRFSIEHE